jgi:hypothetical protein
MWYATIYLLNESPVILNNESYDRILDCLKQYDPKLLLSVTITRSNGGRAPSN